MSVFVAAVVIGGISTAYQIYSGEENRKQQERAQDEARRNAQENARQADIANNRANQKKADVNALMKANQEAASAGGSSTMLTGPGGIDTASLNLGKNTLLGA